jgi:ribonuclease HI
LLSTSGTKIPNRKDETIRYLGVWVNINLNFQKHWNEAETRYFKALERIKNQPIGMIEKSSAINILATSSLLYGAAFAKPNNTRIKKWERAARNIIKKEGKLIRSVNNAFFYTSKNQGGLGLNKISDKIEQEQMRFLKAVYQRDIDPLTKEIIKHKREEIYVTNWNVRNKEFIKETNSVVERWMRTAKKKGVEIEISGEREVCRIMSEIFNGATHKKLREAGFLNIWDLTNEKEELKELNQIKQKKSIKNLIEKEWKKSQKKFEELKETEWKELEPWIIKKKGTTKGAERFENVKFDQSEGEMILYTDGSKKSINGKEVAGYAVYHPKDNRSEIGRINGDQNNYRSELIGILRALKLTHDNQKLKIVTDSMSSIDAINKKIINNTEEERSLDRNSTSAGDVIEAIKQEFIRKGKDNISLSWVESHSGSETEDQKGNEEADKLANKATALEDNDFPKIQDESNNKIKFFKDNRELEGDINMIWTELCKNMHDKEWKEKTWQKKPENAEKAYNSLENLSRGNQRMAVKVRTNTLPTMDVIKKTLRIDCDQCILCGNTDSWSHYRHNHVRWYEVSEIRDRICNQIIKEDNLTDENKLKWTLKEGATLKTSLTTGIISQTTAKMIKEILRGDKEKYKNLGKKWKRKTEKWINKKLKQTQNMVIEAIRELWIDRLQRIEPRMVEQGVREQIEIKKTEEKKKRKDKEREKKRKEQEEIDEELRDTEERDE